MAKYLYYFSLIESLLLQILYVHFSLLMLSHFRDVLCMVNSSEHSTVHQVLMENMSERGMHKFHMYKFAF
jgi:hypothetical protein